MPMDHLYQEGGRQPLIQNIEVTSGWGGNTAELHWSSTLYATQIAGGRDIEMILPPRIMVTGQLERRLRETARRGVIV